MIAAGEAEGPKGTVHAVTGGLAAAMCLYNLIAYRVRGGRMQAFNTAAYAALWGFETYQTYRHWGRADAG